MVTPGVLHVREKGKGEGGREGELGGERYHKCRLLCREEEEE